MRLLHGSRGLLLLQSISNCLLQCQTPTRGPLSLEGDIARRREAAACNLKIAIKFRLVGGIKYDTEPFELGLCCPKQAGGLCEITLGSSYRSQTGNTKCDSRFASKFLIYLQAPGKQFP